MWLAHPRGDQRFYQRTTHQTTRQEEGEGSANCFVTTVHTRMHPGMESLKSRGWTNTRLATCHLSLTSSRRPPQKGPRSRTTWNSKRKIA
ncbi:hypothetical protein TNIN_247151 [Trichonephila inaurata madagascariensis]|uniref:Uncharacterized protein n=1 Tax=Trichonephila inaurata madagascariensis TaxID=2747483 RepID=A0A8X7BQ85_9ARAC|nr:hypothetical protein TNIN_247151 [Trichonephila inaurata madagascariensis]